MKKHLLTLTAFLLLTFGMASMACADVVKLTYSNFFPPTHIQSQLAEQWCREVEKRTDGKIQIDYFPGGTLTKAKQCYDGVVEGISDMGLSVLAYSRGRFPVMAAVDLPLGYTLGTQATRVANAVYNNFQPREFQDVQPMYFHAHGPGVLFTTPKPVTSLADLHGMKIRSTGNSAKLVKALGGTPVAQSMPTSYQSLHKGVVDGSMNPVESTKGWKLAEVVKFGTRSYPVAYTTTFFVVMNKDKWASLDDDTRKIITEINAEWAIKHGKAWDEADDAGKAFFLEKGGQFVDLDEQEAIKWVEAAKPVIQEYYDTVSGNDFDSKAVVEFIHAEMQKE
ncbi:MAG: TRAP transporter substrate-binding protein [Pseudodesulfovibrio sp.]|nr:TRAP transporter substrate-binding protein [Pseudodesulfovibrio sp.]